MTVLYYENPETVENRLAAQYLDILKTIVEENNYQERGQWCARCEAWPPAIPPPHHLKGQPTTHEPGCPYAIAERLLEEAGVYDP